MCGSGQSKVIKPKQNTDGYNNISRLNQNKDYSNFDSGKSSNILSA